MPDLWKLLVSNLSWIATLFIILHFVFNGVLEDAKRAAFMTTDVLSELKFILHRSNYAPLNSFLDPTDSMRYAVFDDYISIIEPYSDMNVVILDQTNENFVYTCQFCPVDTTTGITSTEGCYVLRGSIASLQLEAVKISCNAFDVYSIYLKEFADITSMASTRESKGYGLCMYVRRDLKSLTEEHLNRTMNAFFTLWATSENDGQALYGENFHSSQWFSEAHLFNAGQQDSDHIHEGQGFLYQHIKISNMFELAIQSVDPSVSLPYWDYTYDSEMYDNVSMSAMFTPESFGSIRFPTDGNYWYFANDSVLDAVIPDGRWANAKAGSYDLFPNLINPYGYLRGPWNTNPSPYISRFATAASSLPTCESLYSLANMSTLADFSEQAPYSPHGLTHKTVGGTFGCDVFDDLVDDGLILYPEKKNSGICVNWFLVVKELYRGNYIGEKSDCSAASYERDGFSCGFECDDDTDMTLILSSLMDQAGSPSDPSFWPIHPNLERLLHARLMAGGFDDNTWPTAGQTLCNKFICYEADEGAKGEFDQCCYGHNEGDQLLDFVTGDATAGYGPTNAEILQWTDPTSQAYAMPYVYDDFTWSHCSDYAGYDFSALFESLAARRKR